jgi:hypothetical protein
MTTEFEIVNKGERDIHVLPQYLNQVPRAEVVIPPWEKATFHADLDVKFRVRENPPLIFYINMYQFLGEPVLEELASDEIKTIIEAAGQAIIKAKNLPPDSKITYGPDNGQYKVTIY